MIVFEKTIESSFEAVNELVNLVMDQIENEFTMIDARQLFKINFMLREILNNAVEHGNHFQLDKDVFLEVVYEEPILAFLIKDEGEGVNKSDIDPDKLDADFLLRERQRGYQTIREMDFDIKVKGNEVTVLLNLNQEVKLWKHNC